MLNHAKYAKYANKHTYLWAPQFRSNNFHTYLWAYANLNCDFRKTEKIELNKHVHALNGNIEIINRDIIILQLNTSNSNFISKIEDLKITVNENNADVVMISESNMDTDNPEMITLRETKFPNYV